MPSPTASPTRRGMGSPRTGKSQNGFIGAISGIHTFYWFCGPLVIGTAALTFSFTSLAIKLISILENNPSIPPFETVNLSGLANIVALAAVVKYSGLQISLSGKGYKNTFLTLGRSLFGALATTCFYLSLDMLSLKDAVTLFFTSPVIAAILDWLVNGHSQGWRGAAATFLTLAGVVCVTQPPFIFGDHSTPSSGQPPETPGTAALTPMAWLTTGYRVSHSGEWTAVGSPYFAAAAAGSAGWGAGAAGDAPAPAPAPGDEALLGAVLATMAAACNASGFLCVAMLKGAVHPLVITWWYNLVIASIAAVPLGMGFFSGGSLGAAPVLPTPRGWWLIGAVAITQFAAQLCLNRGFQLESASRGSAINVLQVLFSFLIDVFCLGNIPSPLSVAGSALVASGVLFVALTPDASKHVIAEVVVAPHDRVSLVPEPEEGAGDDVACEDDVAKAVAAEAGLAEPLLPGGGGEEGGGEGSGQR